MNTKRTAAMLLATVLCSHTMHLVSLAAPLITISGDSQEAGGNVLKNQDVLDMLKMGLTPEVVLAKIKNSASKFDTSPKALQELKAAGVPDSIILAMVQAESGTASANSGSATTSSRKVQVPDGIAVEVELMQNVSSEELKEGDPVAFKVVRPVEINGVTVIKKDATARGHVVKVKKAGRWGKQGKLDWAMNDAISVDGTKIPLRFTQAARGDSKGGTVAVAAVATTVLLGPVGLLWGLKKGKPAIIPAGNKYTVYVDGESTVLINAEAGNL
jgi:hypothetical protein